MSDVKNGPSDAKEGTITVHWTWILCAVGFFLWAAGALVDWHASRVCSNTCEPKLGRISTSDMKCRCFIETFSEPPK